MSRPQQLLFAEFEKLQRRLADAEAEERAARKAIGARDSDLEARLEFAVRDVAELQGKIAEIESAIRLLESASDG